MVRNRNSFKNHRCKSSDSAILSLLHAASRRNLVKIRGPHHQRPLLGALRGARIRCSQHHENRLQGSVRGSRCGFSVFNYQNSCISLCLTLQLQRGKRPQRDGPSRLRRCNKEMLGGVHLNVPPVSRLKRSPTARVNVKCRMNVALLVWLQPAGFGRAVPQRMNTQHRSSCNSYPSSTLHLASGTQCRDFYIEQDNLPVSQELCMYHLSQLGCSHFDAQRCLSQLAYAR